MNLNKALPFAAVTFVIGGAASMGLPGFSGFVAELQVLQGAWVTFPIFTALAGVGILIGVAYTLRATIKAFYAETDQGGAAAPSYHQAHALEPISIPEKIGGVVLLVTTLVVGLYPAVLLDLIVPTITNSQLFAPLIKGGAL
jgi:NADH-quinone oxidoreductase subunit M